MTFYLLVREFSVKAMSDGTHIVVLSLSSLLQIVLLALELHDLLPELGRLLAQIGQITAFHLQRLQTQLQCHLLVLGQLLLGLRKL